LRIQRIDGIARYVRDAARGLHSCAGRVGVVEHYVVRIDEIHRQEPRFLRGGQFTALAAQPAARHRGGDTVVPVAALRVRNDVADPDVVREPVGLHFLREDLRGAAELIDGLEFLGQVPLALVGRVIARFAQHVADRANVGRHALDPRKVRVVEHPRVLDVLAGVQHRSGRRAHAGIDRVVGKDRAPLHQALMRRQRVPGGQLARPKEALLVRQDEDDVVGPPSAGGSRAARYTMIGCGRCRRSDVSATQTQRDRAGSGGAQELAARESGSGRPVVLHCLLLRLSAAIILYVDSIGQNETESS
jgi:hypothetical protein